MASENHASYVGKEVDKVISKFSTYKDHATEEIEELLKNLHKVQEKLKAVQDDTFAYETYGAEINTICQNIKLKSSKLSAAHKDLHSTVSKVGKSVDKNFKSDYSAVCLADFLEGSKQQNLNEVLCNHYSREGLYDVANTLAKEADINVPDLNCSPYKDIIHIVKALREQSLQPALDWVENNKKQLNQNKSSLEFKLHKMKYLTILQLGPNHILEAIEYGRTHLTQYINQYEKVVQMLFGCILYGQTGLAGSPYEHLLQPSEWEHLCTVFTKDVCTILGISVDSPLAVVLDVGCSAFPKLFNIKFAMDSRCADQIFAHNDEIPAQLYTLQFEIALNPRSQYHSMFACPILRQQSTSNNPPMKLVCGHVISRDALNRLMTGNKLKCPYCPIEQSGDDATYVYF